MQVLECLQRETPDTRGKLAQDAGCLGALEEWVLDLTDDRMSFHVLETLLKVWLLCTGCPPLPPSPHPPSSCGLALSHVLQPPESLLGGVGC